MKRKTKYGGIFILVMMLATVFSISGAFAQDEYDPLPGSKTDVEVTKTLDLHGATEGPDHDVTFTATYINSTPSGLPSPGGSATMSMSFSGSKTTEKKSMDFSAFSFKKPGIYKFSITEAVQGTLGIKNVGQLTYYIMVYIDNVKTEAGDSELQWTGYKVYKSNYTIDTNKTSNIKFENEWDNYRIKIKKEVTGNQGDKSKEFDIIYSISGFGNGKVIYAKKLSGSPKVGTEKIGDTPYKINGSGTGSSNNNITLKLKDGDSVELYGMNKGMKATVTESPTSRTDYTVTGEQTNLTEVEKTNDNLVTIVNHKSGTIPTGIFINNWPYITVILLVIAGSVIFIRRRKARYDYEADL